MRNSEAAVGRREVLKGLAVLGVAEKLSDGGFADVTRPGRPARGTSVLPPGAGDRARFARRCTACQLCVAKCPEKVLKPSVSLRTFGQPELDFRDGYCRVGCTRCASVCPTGAIEPLSKEARRYVRVGCAAWSRERCVRTTNGDACTACVRKCPAKAVHLVAGFPTVDAGRCLGCGACEHVCPARPEPAIFVKGYEVQRKTEPMGGADLRAEMMSLIDQGHAAAVAKDGVIVRVLDGRGVRPIVEALEADAESFADAEVVDKVVGRAAAAVYVIGRARSVRAKVMTTRAKELLRAHGIAAESVETVAAIVNREGTGNCPMETALDGLEDPADMLAALREKTHGLPSVAE